MRLLASSVVAAITIACLLGLAAGGMYVATRSASDNVMRASEQVAASAIVAPSLTPVILFDAAPRTSDIADDVNSADLDVRGQPMRWSQAEENAVRLKAEGGHYDPDDYRAALRAAQYNQKNGWTDDGSERLSQGTPLRNNQKRGGSSNDGNSCLQSFRLEAAVCGDGGEDITGDEGVGDSDLGGIDLGDI
jgi:hypothetical protein